MAVNNRAIGLLFVGLVFVSCGKLADTRPDKSYLDALQQRRVMNDVDRQVLVAKCGDVIGLWQEAIAREAAAGQQVSEFASHLQASDKWKEFHARRELEDDAMRSLMNPPPQYQVQYEKVLRQYGYITRLLALLEKPTGSLVSYTAEVRALASDYDQLKAELDVSLPKVSAAQ
ncbi:MAG TPA: hypothetical protein VG710_14055 [Opitutus sp.]|nr:hypothetical protein [Opitutus sp.]